MNKKAAQDLKQKIEEFKTRAAEDEKFIAEVIGVK